MHLTRPLNLTSDVSEFGTPVSGLVVAAWIRDRNKSQLALIAPIPKIPDE